MRDKANDFTKPIIRKLSIRAGNICSNPDCRSPTSGAKAGEEEGMLNMGVAAHICAASPGGPRYDFYPAMTSVERASYKNGIWLCIKCSTIIDKDSQAYPVPLLQQWKRAAEKNSQDKIGKPAIPETAARDLLATALYGAPLKSGIAQAIENVHGGVEKALEAIDNRFEVTTTRLDGRTTFNLSARETVPFTFTFKNSKAYVDGYRLLVDEGKALVIQSGDFEPSGSALLEQIAAESKTLTIGSTGKPVTAKISTHDKESGRISNFDDIQGQVVFGRLRGTVTGFSMNEMLKLELSIGVDHPRDLKISLSPMMEKWNGKPVASLPYYTKMCSLFRNLNEGHTLNVTLEHMGEHVLSGGTDGVSFKGLFRNTASLFLYVDAARSISSFTGVPILFDDTETIDGDDIDRLIDVAAIAQGESVKSQEEIIWPISFQIEFNENGRQQASLLDGKQGLELHVVEAEGEVVQVFRQRVQMPPKTVQFHGVTQRVVEPIAGTDSKFKCELNPIEGFRMEVFYPDPIDPR